MTNILIVSSTTNPVGANSSGTILPYSGGIKPQAIETSGGQLTWRDAGTWTNLYSRIIANTVTATSTAFYRVAAANGNQTLSIGASATGEFQDTTHSDVAAAGDKIDVKFTTGATGTGLTPGINSMNFAPTTSGNTINKLGCGANNAFSPAGATYYVAMGGFTPAAETTEANVQFKCKLTGTLQNLIAVVIQNIAAASSLNSRIGGINGNCTASITANTTGIYEDTTHTDSVVSGNLINFSVVVGAGTTLGVHSAIDLLTTTGNTHYIANENGAGGATLISGDFSSVAAISNNATESNVQALTTVGSTASNMEGFIVSNTGTGTINFRVGAVNGNQLLTIGSTSTGYFEDTTHSDTLTSASEINYKWTASGTLKLGNIGFMALYSAGGAVTSSGATTEADDTAAASALLTFTGAVAVTEDVDVAAASSFTGSLGSVAVTEANDTAAASALLTFAATAAPTEANDTAAASALLTFSATAAPTEDNDIAAGAGNAGSVDTTSSCAAVEADDTAAGLGVVGVPVPVHSPQLIASGRHRWQLQNREFKDDWYERQEKKRADFRAFVSNTIDPLPVGNQLDIKPIEVGAILKEGYSIEPDYRLELLLLLAA